MSKYTITSGCVISTWSTLSCFLTSLGWPVPKTHTHNNLHQCQQVKAWCPLKILDNNFNNQLTEYVCIWNKLTIDFKIWSIIQLEKWMCKDYKRGLNEWNTSLETNTSDDRWYDRLMMFSLFCACVNVTIKQAKNAQHTAKERRKTERLTFSTSIVFVPIIGVCFIWRDGKLNVFYIDNVLEA